MPRALVAELQKLRSLPTIWWLMAGSTALAVVATLAALAVNSSRDVDLAGTRALQDSLHSVGAGSILVMVAGIVAMAGEFRFGQAEQTFLSFPRRYEVVLAKAACFVVLGLGFGLIAAAGSAGTTWVWLAAEGLPFSLSTTIVWQTLLGGVLSAGIYGVLGVAIGAITRAQVPAIIGAVAWFMIFEPTLFQGSAEVGRWLPGTASVGLRRVPEDELLGMTAGGIVALSWTLLLFAAGLRHVVRADVK